MSNSEFTKKLFQVEKIILIIYTTDMISFKISICYMKWHNLGSLQILKLVEIFSNITYLKFIIQKKIIILTTICSPNNLYV
jgi:hypothetical protein